MGKYFTPGFFRFLLGFTLILALSFATLAFLGTIADTRLSTSGVPGCDSANDASGQETERC